MKIRNKWLGLAVLSVMILLGVVIILRSGSDRPGTDDSAGSRKASPRDAGKTTAHKRPTKKASERPRPELGLPLVSGIVKSGKLPELTDEQAARYLSDSRRSAEALLAVFRIKGDPALLQEAAKSFPDHATVQLELALRGGTPEEKRLGLEAYRKLKPDDAVGDYLSALFHFQQGQQEQAFKDIAQANARSGFGIPVDQQVQGCEDAYLSAGFSLMEAKFASLLGLPRSQTMALNQLASSLSGLHQQYIQAGDSPSADAVLQMGLSLSGRLRQESRVLIDDLVALSIENRFLRQVPPETVLPGSGQTAAKRLEAVTAERSEVSAMTKDSTQTLSEMSEAELLAHFKRVTKDGELNALRWLKDN